MWILVLLGYLPSSNGFDDLPHRGIGPEPYICLTSYKHLLPLLFLFHNLPTASFLSVNLLQGIGKPAVTIMASFFPSLGSKPEAETKFSGGSDTYGDPKALSTGVIDDLKAIGLGRLGGDVQTLLEVAFAKGKPVNDRELVVRYNGFVSKSPRLTVLLRWRSLSALLDHCPRTPRPDIS